MFPAANNGQYNPYSGLGMDPYYGQLSFATNQNPNGYGANAPRVMGDMAPRPQVDPRMFETPQIVTNTAETKSAFSFSKPKPNIITVDNVSDMEVEEKKRKAGRPKKDTSVAPINRDGIEQVQGQIDDKTIYTYGETNMLLHDTLGQIDVVNTELVQEFNAVKTNRTMKNKYTVLNALAENISTMIGNRISTIKEINNCITKANDMDYKKYKDFQAAQSNVTDDKYIADFYKAIIANPENSAPTFTLPQIDQSAVGSGIIRANVPDSILGGGAIDPGYINYVNNLTPEQNLMRYENNPNVKQVVVYDEATGYRSFQMMDMSTGEPIPNLPTYDENIMEDTTLDSANGGAKNLNRRETFPIVTINSKGNSGVMSQY